MLGKNAFASENWPIKESYTNGAIVLHKLNTEELYTNGAIVLHKLNTTSEYPLPVPLLFQEFFQ